MSPPKVSIIFPSYNHAPFIREAMDGVLAQTYTDYEVLVSDDGSTDRSVEILQAYRDPRIQLHAFEKNMGASINHRYLLERCAGEYVALSNSDDVWLPERLEKGVAYLDAHPECAAVFSWAGLIDEQGAVLAENCELFRQPNRTKEEWLYHFFTKANCLCHPSMLIRREVYLELGYYSMGMRQLPDFWMWVRVVKHYNIHILQEVLVRHRRCLTTMQNTSAPITNNSIRDVNESLYILMHYFDDVNDETFRKAFGAHFRNKAASTPEQLVCERFFALLDGRYYMPKVHMLAAMHYYIQNCDDLPMIDALARDYGYDMNAFFQAGTAVDLLGLRSQTTASAPDPLTQKTPWLRKNFGETTAYQFAKRVYHRVRKAAGR